MYDIMFLDGCSGALEAPAGIRGSCATVGKRFLKFTLPLESKSQMILQLIIKWA